MLLFSKYIVIGKFILLVFCYLKIFFFLAFIDFQIQSCKRFLMLLILCIVLCDESQKLVC